MWVKDIEVVKDFYCRYVNTTANNKYINEKKQFQSYFLLFDGGPRLEIMQMPSVPNLKHNVYDRFTGFIHFAVSLGSKEMVDELTERFGADGFEVIDEPLTTGDGYYERVILDGEKNRVELTV